MSRVSRLAIVVVAALAAPLSQPTAAQAQRKTCERRIAGTQPSLDAPPPPSLTNFSLSGCFSMPQ